MADGFGREAQRVTLGASPVSLSITMNEEGMLGGTVTSAVTGGPVEDAFLWVTLEGEGEHDLGIATFSG